MFFYWLAGLLIGVAATILGFMFYIDADLKPRLRAAERELRDVKCKWDCSVRIANRLSEAAVTDEQKAAAASAASVIRCAVQESLNNA